MERRRLLLITQGFMLAAAGALAVLSALDAVTPGLLLTLTFALGLGAAFNFPAWQAIQPELVPAHELKQAVTLGGANINLGRAIGPAVGGLLIAAAGPWLVFALNAASFAFVFVVLWRWKRPVEEDVGPPERFAGAVRAGIRYAMFSHILHGVLVRSFAFGVASSGFMSLLPVYASEELGWGSGGLGILFGAMGAGAVVTAAVIPSVRARLSADRVFAAGSVLVAAGLVALALVRAPVLAVAASFVVGVGWLFCLSTLNVASQEVLPGWVRAKNPELARSLRRIAELRVADAVSTPARQPRCRNAQSHSPCQRGAFRNDRTEALKRWTASM
jgi:MFS family permease